MQDQPIPTSAKNQELPSIDLYGVVFQVISEEGVYMEQETGEAAMMWLEQVVNQWKQSSGYA